MRIRLPISVIVIALLMCVPALAADKAPMDLPIYPGGESTMEINLSNDDLLPLIKSMLPMLSGSMGQMAEKINPNELAAIFKDVKRIEVTQVSVSKPDVTASDVVGYYAKNLPKGDWNRVFWQSGQPMGTVAIYVQGQGESIYGFQVQTVTVDGKPVKQVMIGKTEGKLDFAKLVSLAAAVGILPGKPAP